MTNSTKKPAKASRENLDLDLDARLDQATSTLSVSLDNEPVVGDALDQVLAHAKKELDTNLPKETLPKETLLPAAEEVDEIDNLDDFLPEVDIDLENDDSHPFQPIQSAAMSSLENQLAAAMDSTVVSDEELDDLLGGAGYDFDSLLGEAVSDELTTDTNDEDLMAAVDELLNIGTSTEEPESIADEIVELEPEVEPKIITDEIVELEPEVEPEIIADEIVELAPEIEAEVIADEIVELKPEVEPVSVADEIVELEPEIEPEVIADEIVELKPEVEPEIIADEIVELAPEVEPEIIADEIVELEPEIEPEIIADEIVELAPEVEPEIIADEIVELTPEVEPEIIADEIVELAPEVEPEIIADEIVELAPEVEPEIIADEIVELAPEVEPEIIADEIVELAPEVEPEIIADEIVELAPEVEPEIIADEIVEPEENEFESDAELTVDPEVALDDLVDTVPFEETLIVDKKDDELDEIQEEFNDFDNVADIDAPLVEMSASIESFDDDLDEMQQLNGLNDAMENKKDTTAAGFDLLDDNAAGKENSTPITELEDDDLSWLKQLEPVEDEIEEEFSPSVNLEKTDENNTEESADDLDWMKQLEGLEEETASQIPAESSDDSDWMKQLEDLENSDSDTASPSTSVNLEKTAEEPADDSDWMKQLDGLDDHDEDTAAMLMDATHDSDTKVEEKSNSDSGDKFNIADEAPQPAVNQAKAIDEDALIAKAAGVAISQFKEEQNHALSQLRADQDSIEGKSRMQFAEAESKNKKSATFGYIALGVGLIGVLGSAGIGWFSYGTKTETTTLTETVAELEGKVDTFLAKNPEKEIENIKVSVDQLNQKVEKLTVAQAAMLAPPVVAEAAVPATPAPAVDAEGKPVAPIAQANSSVDLLNSQKTEPNAEGSKIPELAVPAMGEMAAHISTKAAEPAKLAEMTKKPNNDKAIAAAKATSKADAEKAAAKAEAEKAAVKAAAESLSQKVTKANVATANAKAENAKVDEERKLIAQLKVDRYKGRMTRGMAHGAADSAAEAAKAKPKKEVLNTAVKPEKPAVVGKYSVNMLSYQQEWFAQSKAAEFKQKGIPVEVVPTDPTKPGTSFRLKVGGFKTKSEADAYSDKVKKSLDLKETWVGSTNN